MDEYVLQGNGQQGQMDAGQPLSAADVTFSEPTQNQQQPQPVSQEDAFAGFTPSEPITNESDPFAGFTPIEAPMGSMEAVNQAAAQAPLVGRDTFRPRSLLVEQADLMLGRESAKKFQAFEASGGNPEVPIEFSPKEQKLLNEYRFNQARRGVGMAAGLAAGIGLSQIPGGQTVGGEMIAGVGSELLRQTIAPEPYDIQEAAAQGIPLLSFSKRGAGGFRSPLQFLTTAETGVTQQSSRLKQILKEGAAGGMTGAAQGFASTLGDESGKTEEIIKQGALSGLFLPTFSGGLRGLGALSRSGGSLKRFAGELQRPYTQQFLTERADAIRRELGAGGGIDPALAGQLADTLSSPQLSGTRPEDIRAWQGNITDFLQNSIRTGTANGLSGDELTNQIVSELKRVTERKDIDQNLISGIVLNAQQMIDEAKRKVDVAFNEKNAELLGAARRAEGELQLQSKSIFDDIRNLETQKKDLRASDDIMRTQIDNEIADKQRQIDEIENGFDPKFGYGKFVTQFETGKQFGEYANILLQEFKDKQKAGYDALEPKLKSISVSVPKKDKFGKTVKDENGNDVIETFTLDDLKNQRTEILNQIDFNKKVQQADYDTFQELDRVQKIMEDALNTDPDFKVKFKAQNAQYREGINRFKGSIISSLLRDVGEGGGSPEAVLSLLGTRGGQALEVMKKVAGSEWEPTFKPLLEDFVYNKLRKVGQTPEEFLSLLTEAKMGKGSQLTGEVASEFFPQLSEIQDVAARYKDLIDKKANLTTQKNDLLVKSKELEARIARDDKAAVNLFNENERKLKSVTAEIQRLEQPRPYLGKEIKEMDARTKQITAALADLQSAVNGKLPIKLDDEQIKLILSNPDSNRLAKDLQLYVQQASREATDFQKMVLDATKTGRLSANQVQPEDVVKFLTTDYGKQQRYVVQEFMNVMRNERPDLVGDIQNLVVGNLFKDSLDAGKKQVNINKMRELISGQYNPLIVEAFGKSGVDQMNRIADQLSVVIEKDSLVKSKLIPAVTSAVASAFGANMYGRMALSNLAAVSGAAAIGRILKNPDYLATVTKPIDQVAKDQMDAFNRRWPKILTLEADRLKMRNDEREEAERPQIPSASVRRF
jgi:predicted  nucleic acid-binding Zn-ribbon protein